MIGKPAMIKSVTQDRPLVSGREPKGKPLVATTGKPPIKAVAKPEFKPAGKASATRLDRAPRAAGGRTKGKTTVNVIVAPQGGPGPAGGMPPGSPPVVRPMPAPPPQMAARPPMLEKMRNYGKKA